MAEITLAYTVAKNSLTPFRLDMDTHCHTLVTGSSGSGKSFFLLRAVGVILQAVPDIMLYFCDFKNSEEFSFLHGYRYYYAGDLCLQGLADYYNLFCTARKGGQNRCKKHLLIFDEYPAFINYFAIKDKAEKTKNASDAMSMLSEILCMGRGYFFGCTIATQRADASLFPNGSRDNFMTVIGLGRLSREQKGMLFSGEDIPERIYKPGQGIILADGYPLKEIQIPRIADINGWKKHTQIALSAGLHT